MITLDELWDAYTVYDSDNPFSVDPFTRNIVTKYPQKSILIEGDHNSERFSFAVPRFIEGRDIGKCNVVQVCYINVGNKGTVTGVYTVNDMEVYPFVNDILTFSWLISANATKNPGKLNFMLRFVTMDDDGEIQYAWHTNVYEGVRVIDSINADEAFEDEYVDIIYQWKTEVMGEMYKYVETTVQNQVDVAQISTNAANISTLAQETSTLRARMDVFAALEEGSTTGDAELMDIRVDVDGVTHENAGTAVRKQINSVTTLKQDILTTDVIQACITSTKGMLDFKNNSTYNGAGVYKEYAVSPGQIVKVSGRAYSVDSNVCYALCGCYDSNKNLVRSYGISPNTNYVDFAFIVPDEVVSVIVNGGDVDTVRTNGYVRAELKICERRSLNDEFEDLIKDPTSNLFFPVSLTGAVQNGFYNFDTSTVVSGGACVSEYTVNPGDILAISGRSRSVSHGYNYAMCGFVDHAGNNIELYGLTPDTNYHDIMAVVPKNAVKLIVNGGNGSDTTETTANVLRCDRHSIHDAVAFSNRWRGKKIGFIGTSVLFGANSEKSYALEAANHLGFIMKNFGVPGLGLHTNADGSKLAYGSFSMSKTEYSDQGVTIPDAPIPYSPNGYYNDYYRTYQNVFTSENEDVDLWIYAVVPNNVNFDTTDWDIFDKDNWCYNDGSSFDSHRTTFLGALLFIMDKMYTLNPDARMVLLLDSAFAYDYGRESFNILRDEWNIPVIDLWGNINTSPRSIVKLKSVNGTDNHPSTFAHEIMGNMLAGYLHTIV